MSDHDHGHDDHDHGHVHDASCGHDHGAADDHVHDANCGHDHDDHGHGHGHGHDEAPAFDAAAFGGEDVCGDGGIYKKVLSPGDGGEHPPVGAKVKVHYVGTLLDGSKFDSSRDRPGNFEFKLGVGQVITGWDKGVATMTKGEKAIFICRHDYAYGEQGSPPKIPARATLQFEVELFSWKEQRKEKDSLSPEGRLVYADELKAKGTVAFKAGKLDEASELYSDAAGYIELPEAPAGSEDAAAATLLSCLLNGATCGLKLEDYGAAEECCTRAIGVEESTGVPGGRCVKAYFRRGQARMAQAEFATAKADLREASKLDPKSKEVRDAYAACQAKEAEAKKKEKAVFGKMFG